MKKFLLWLVGILLVFYFMGKCNNDSNTPGEIITDTTGIISSVDTSEVTPVSATGWTYTDREDKMTSKKTYYASVDASELLYFDFPYDGGSTATLCVRKKLGETDVFIKFSKAQLIIDSYDGSNFRVRFDKNQASIYSFTGASDHSSDIAFLQNTSRFIKNLKKSKSVTIELEFYKEGNRAIEFNIEGFKWNH